jgi:hypothetical protein
MDANQQASRNTTHHRDVIQSILDSQRQPPYPPRIDPQTSPYCHQDEKNARTPDKLVYVSPRGERYNSRRELLIIALRIRINGGSSNVQLHCAPVPRCKSEEGSGCLTPWWRGARRTNGPDDCFVRPDLSPFPSTPPWLDTGAIVLARDNDWLCFAWVLYEVPVSKATR